jgi:hypothetical protein
MIVSVTFSGIPGDRDLTFMTAALEALGYEVSVDPEYSDVQIKIRPDVDTGPEYRRRGTEDTGPEYRRRGTEDTGPAAPLKLNDSAQGDQTIET